MTTTPDRLGDSKGGHRDVPSACVYAKDPEDAYPLVPHLLDTAVVANHLWRTWVRPGLRQTAAAAIGTSEDQAGRLLCLAAGLHDVGKANPFFQLQERFTPQPWTEKLAAEFSALGLGATDETLRLHLLGDHAHPLRRHEYISFRAVAGRWPNHDARRLISQHWIAAVVGGHHGYWRMPTADAADLGEELIGAGWTEHQAATVELVSRAVGVAPSDVAALEGLAMVPFVVFSGILTLADWIASDEARVAHGKRLTRAGLDAYTDPAAWMAERERDLQPHTDECLAAISPTLPADLAAAVLEGRQPRPLQHEALGLAQTGGDRGLWVCMYPTGEGKSEAAMLRHSLHADEGMLFGLPTVATTDAMETRLAPWVSATGAALVKSHQFAGAPQPRTGTDDDSCCDVASAPWFTSTIRKLVAPHVVMTVDQILAGALRQRHVTLRLLGLANHHVVIDEVHTFDAYQMALLVELLAWWGATGTRVTLLTATLPRRQLEVLVEAFQRGTNGGDPVTEDGRGGVPAQAPFPGHVFVPADPEAPIRVGPGATTASVGTQIPATEIDLVAVGGRRARVEEHVSWAVATASDHPSSPIGVISNVVDDCCQIAQQIQDRLGSRGIGSHDVECLHSRMVQEHREEKAARLLARVGKDAHRAGFTGAGAGAGARGGSGRPMIVVGTQVIQASLDIDFDFLATDLAPAPDLLQRLGRQWRFGASQDRTARVKSASRRLRVVAVLGDDGLASAGAVPYPVSVLARTYRWLDAHRGVFDVLAQAQEFIDAADVALTPEDLVEAQEETVKKALQDWAAADSKAPLKERLATRMQRTTWADLVRLTERNDAEDAMRTRYIDAEGPTLLLFSTAPATGGKFPKPLPPGGLARVAQMTGPAAAGMTRWVVRVPPSVSRAAAEAHQVTLADAGLTKWQPQSLMVSGILPVALERLSGFDYDALCGLTAHKEE